MKTENEKRSVKTIQFEMSAIYKSAIKCFLIVYIYFFSSFQKKVHYWRLDTKSIYLYVNETANNPEKVRFI